MGKCCRGYIHLAFQMRFSRKNFDSKQSITKLLQNICCKIKIIDSENNLIELLLYRRDSKILTLFYLLIFENHA